MDDATETVKTQPEPLPEPEVKQQENVEEPETPKAESSSSSWFSNTNNLFWNAKQKMLDTVDLVRKDLAEFGQVMTDEVTDLTSAAKEELSTLSTNTVNIIKKQAEYLDQLVSPSEEVDVAAEIAEAAEADATIAEAVEEKEEENLMKIEAAEKISSAANKGFSWMKNAFGSISDTVKNLAMEDSYEGEEEFTVKISPKKPRGRNLNLSEGDLLTLQSNDKTYLEHHGDQEVYENFMESFDLIEHSGEIELMLANNKVVKEKFEQYKDTVPEITFWSNYFYNLMIADVNSEMDTMFTLKKPVPPKGADSAQISPVVDQPTSPAHSADDWSLCNEKEEKEELDSDAADHEVVDVSPETPVPRDEPENTDDSSEKQKEDGWVNWDE